MKKRQSKTIFKFIGNKIYDPFQMIAILFDSASPDYYKCLIKDVLLHTHLERAYSKTTTSSMLFFLKNIKQFLKLAYAIMLEGYENTFTLSGRDMYNAHYFTDSKDVTKHWQMRPVVLSIAEYKDPYLVFKTVFEQEDFKSMYVQFKEAFEYGCSTNTMVDLAFNPLALYLNVSKIIEACYLIHVRNVYYNDGQ